MKTISNEKNESEKQELTNLLNMPLLKKHILVLVTLVEKKPDLLPLVFEILKSEKQHDVMVASWLLSHLWDSSPGLLKPWQFQIVQQVLVTKFDSVRRNLLRILDGLPILPDQMGILFDACLGWMISDNYAIAVRCNAMQILYRVCCIEPALIQEVRQHIEVLLEYGTAGFQSRGKKVLKQFDILTSKQCY
ncbi:MAG: hypothetical protein CVT92_01910 [Bacteroidetes bacterium HGW-Bacteroidetes-1]|jgi:hypothetical protein|nr:MAG: hypothetical protein CVT92_01910 [Bacteroidetes bacterium HGW-Bacteroidetes-1]